MVSALTATGADTDDPAMFIPSRARVNGPPALARGAFRAVAATCRFALDPRPRVRRRRRKLQVNRSACTGTVSSWLSGLLGTPTLTWADALICFNPSPGHDRPTRPLTYQAADE